MGAAGDCEAGEGYPRSSQRIDLLLKSPHLPQEAKQSTRFLSFFFFSPARACHGPSVAALIPPMEKQLAIESNSQNRDYVIGLCCLFCFFSLYLVGHLLASFLVCRSRVEVEH